MAQQLTAAHFRPTARAVGHWVAATLFSAEITTVAGAAARAIAANAIDAKTAEAGLAVGAAAGPRCQVSDAFFVDALIATGAVAAGIAARAAARCISATVGAAAGSGLGATPFAITASRAQGSAAAAQGGARRRRRGKSTAPLAIAAATASAICALALICGIEPCGQRHAAPFVAGLIARHTHAIANTLTADAVDTGTALAFHAAVTSVAIGEAGLGGVQ